MNRPATLLSVALLLTLLVSLAPAQNLALQGRSAIEINLGLWAGGKASTTTGTAGILSEAETNGLSAGVGYAYWLREHLSLTITASLLSGKSSTTVSLSQVSQRSSSVMPLLLGLRFYVPEPEAGQDIRPFVSAAIGPYFGTETSSAVLSQSTHTETAIGGRLGVGIAFLLGEHFELGAAAGYNVMADFPNPIGARKNYSGADFSIGIGYIF